MANTNKQRLLDGIEALYPADANHQKIAFIGQILLQYALDNTLYNWRNLPDDILERYLAVCEEYETDLINPCSKVSMPHYLRF
ncbi:MAG: hypothetical protein HAW62_03935 [Endozoicomonadaceae bacterium]|nr:hypothetical protein [Endozoicomonadaceae bacterium]